MNRLKDFIDIYRNKKVWMNLKIRSFKDLKIVSSSYDQEIVLNDKNDLWKMFCRGAVINSDHKIISNEILSTIKWFRYPSIKEVLMYETLSENFDLNSSKLH